MRRYSTLRDRKITRQKENIGVKGREEDILRGWETGRQEDRETGGNTQSWDTVRSKDSRRILWNWKRKEHTPGMEDRQTKDRKRYWGTGREEEILQS